MKTLIEITNNMGTKEIVNLDQLREMICERRYNKLSGAGLAKQARREVTVFTTEKTNQPATSYRSFEIRKMNAKQAIDLFNDGGSQVAKMIEKN